MLPSWLRLHRTSPAPASFLHISSLQSALTELESMIVKEVEMQATQPQTADRWAEELALPEGVAEAIRSGLDLRPLLRRQLILAAVGATLFGAALGTYGWNLEQVMASAVKAPLLLLGATALCFPSFYVLQLLRASRPATLARAAALQAAALGATGAVWGSLSLPLVFLTTTTVHYRLTQFLALVIGAGGGLAGARRLAKLYRAVCEDGGPRRRLIILLPYVVLYGAVGGQLAWLLRPFIGSPELPFQLFRPLEGNMLSAIFNLFFR